MFKQLDTNGPAYIDERGQVRDLRMKRIDTFVDDAGYLKLKYIQNHIEHERFVHIEVARHFTGILGGVRADRIQPGDVKHIDGDKENNLVSNLVKAEAEVEAEVEDVEDVEDEVEVAEDEVEDVETEIEADPEDLTAIKGVGPKTAERLLDAGVRTRAEVANMSHDRLVGITGLSLGKAIEVIQEANK